MRIAASNTMMIATLAIVLIMTMRRPMPPAKTTLTTLKGTRTLTTIAAIAVMG